MNTLSFDFAVIIIALLVYHTFMLQRAVNRLVKRSSLSEERVILSREQTERRWAEIDRRAAETHAWMEKTSTEAAAYRAESIKRSDEAIIRGDTMIQLQREQVALLQKLVDQKTSDTPSEN